MIPKKKIDVDILGTSCAAYSLAKYLKDNTNDNVSFSTKIYGEMSEGVRKDHYWGFWEMPWLNAAVPVSKKKWNRWVVIDANEVIEHQSSLYPYCALSSQEWLTLCADDGDYETDQPLRNNSLVLDSRFPVTPSDCLIQEFVGQTVKIKKNIFDSQTAVIMDFRCNQSEGLHFIYFLPFSETEALVESTRISKSSCTDQWYQQEIGNYLKSVHRIDNFAVLEEERGKIPLANVNESSKSALSIGTRSGCLRGSSGYAFGSIQRQVQQLARDLAKGKNICRQKQVLRPYSKLVEFMDRVFLRVIENNPRKAPQIFINTAKSLNGSEFALFMSGRLNFKILFQVVLALPKRIFLIEFSLELLDKVLERFKWL